MGTPKMNSSSARIGYARVSTADQNLDAQMAALEAASCTMVRTETGDGTTLAGRPELRTILDFIHPGETLVVTRVVFLFISSGISRIQPSRQVTRQFGTHGLMVTVSPWPEACLRPWEPLVVWPGLRHPEGRSAAKEPRSGFTRFGPHDMASDDGGAL